jgi:ABC-type multidrug transport system fused ATPase/permease subunit
LARAVYFDADVVLLDSPLAAVDSHVSSHLIEKCLLGDRGFGSKTRILITHHLEVLPMADLVLVMEQGRIVQQGTYAELVSVPGVLQTLVEEHGNEDETAEDGQGDDTKKDDAAENIDFAKAKGQPNTLKLMMDEERNTGGVTSAIYVAYARVMGTEWYFPTSMVLVVLSQACSVLNTLFLGFWSGRTISGFQQGDYIALYATFGALTTLCTFFGSYALFLAGIRASFILFDSALRSVLRSPVSFHDATPVGRIIHRLSADIEKLDDRLTYQWYNFLASFMAVIGTVFLVFYTYPYLGVIFAPLLLIYYLVGKFYSRTSRENKRIDSLLRSFVYTAFGEQLGGMSIIRAFGNQKRFLRRMQKTADSQMRSEYVMIALSRWLILRLDTLGTVLVLGIALFGVGFRNDVDPIKLGVVLTYSLRTAQVFGFMVHYGVQIEQDMNTTERVSLSRMLASKIKVLMHDFYIAAASLCRSRSRSCTSSASRPAQRLAPTRSCRLP